MFLTPLLPIFPSILKLRHYAVCRVKEGGEEHVEKMVATK